MLPGHVLDTLADGSAKRMHGVIAITHDREGTHRACTVPSSDAFATEKYSTVGGSESTQGRCRLTRVVLFAMNYATANYVTRSHLLPVHLYGVCALPLWARIIPGGHR